MAKAFCWAVADTEARQRGEQTGLDTPVVRAVNAGHWAWRVSTPAVPERTWQVSRLGSTAARLKLKGIDGGPHKRWSMWFNSKQREEPYLGLTCWCKPVETSAPLRSASTGAAWLSSARVVRCWVKSRNERNSRSQLPAVRPGTLGGLPALSRRKVGTTSSHHGPYVWGHTRATMGATEGTDPARVRQSSNASSVRIVGCNSPT